MSENPAALRRDLEFLPLQHEGKQLVFIRDALGLVREGLAFPATFCRILALLDGNRSVSALQLEIAQAQGGKLISAVEVRELLDELDSLFLLDSPSYAQARATVLAEYAARPVRPAAHAGRAFADDPAALSSQLDAILRVAPAPSAPEGQLAGLVAPHIDPQIGARVYSCAYQMLRAARPSRVIVLGVGHSLMHGLFSLTEKDFDTPLGRVRTDKDAVRLLSLAAGECCAGDDYAHRAEHSVEFQVVFLQHVLAPDSFSIVPVLCGSLLSGLPRYSRDAFLEKAGPFLDVLRDLADTPGTLLLAGVDFSHFGLKFGHPQPASLLEAQAKAHDTALLERLAAADAPGFWAESVRVQDCFNVCGFSALACLLEAIPQARGQVLGYDIWHEQPTHSAVSFAALAYA